MMRTLKSILSLLIICALLTTQFSTAANARFILPDDWDPTMQGVGTNRYAYAGNDPVNKSDPNGHFVVAAIGFIAAVLGALFGGTTPANAPGHNDTPESISDGRQIANMAMGATAGTILEKVAKAGLEAYDKKKDKETIAKEETTATSINEQAGPEDIADAPKTNIDKSAAGVRTGYNDMDEIVQTSAGPVKIEARVNINGNNASVDVQNISGPGAGNVGFSETKSIGSAMADKVRSDYGITGDVTFSGTRVSGARTGLNSAGWATFPGE